VLSALLLPVSPDRIILYTQDDQVSLNLLQLLLFASFCKDDEEEVGQEEVGHEEDSGDEEDSDDEEDWNEEDEQQRLQQYQQEIEEWEGISYDKYLSRMNIHS
jgi:hypothetical protein